ncbi:MAG: hypothetical protein KKD25_17930 [Gammaproteobacteria bacterium]|nr:hypothetical protein [Gammaproteobacteria bacterium]MBU0770088.1 hypothetical protein [Gammaproteobacteria bacterium]MBU0855603.1 hypothetical protein [Gammaproteobacteria bacterium]MBU1848166.1 hypothetical protein [Gammaproteobacteria bacterium]
MVAILARGSERLLRLQSDMAASKLAGNAQRLETPVNVTAAMATAWQLPALYSDMFEQAAALARDSYHVMSQMHVELADLAFECMAAQGPVLAQVIAGSNATFAERRSTSVVIDFPDRRGALAREKAASSRSRKR